MAIYLTPGPAAAYPKLKDYLDDAWNEDVMSISHRGAKFTDIYRRAEDGLRGLMDVPTDWRVVFVGSATEAMERLVQGLVTTRSHHFVNGAFSKKWHQIAGQLGKDAMATKVVDGSGFEEAMDDADLDGAELICATVNETSTGVMWPEADLRRIGERKDGALLALDIVSSAPVTTVPWDASDAVFFSVQKAFGLPAGLGVMLLGPRALERAEAMEAAGHATGSYHRLQALAAGAAKRQTPATPNVLGIYLLARVAEDMAQVGGGALRAQTAARADRLYTALEQHAHLEPFVADTAWRSPTVVVAHAHGGSAAVRDHLRAGGFIAGSGYGVHKDLHVRLANFPATSAEEFEAAHAYLVQFDGPRV